MMGGGKAFAVRHEQDEHAARHAPAAPPPCHKRCLVNGHFAIQDQLYSPSLRSVRQVVCRVSCVVMNSRLQRLACPRAEHRPGPVPAEGWSAVRVCAVLCWSAQRHERALRHKVTVRLVPPAYYNSI